MRPRKVPATSLAHSLVVPHTRDTRRLFTRLSKASLIAIAKRWLDPAHVKHFSPNLVLPSPDDEEEFSLEEALEVYDDLARSNAIRAKDVAERMLEVEWRDGASLLGIAELEWQYLIDHPSSSKWQSFVLSPLSTSSAPLRPRFYTPTFLSSLQTSLKPLQTAHFFAAIHPSPTLSLTVIRISLHDLHTPPVYPSSKRSIFFLAFLQGSDHIFTTFGATNTDGLRDTIMSAIAHAVSRQNCRFELKPGRFVAKTLESMCSHRGAHGSAGGLAARWSIYLDGFENNPLALPKEVVPEEEGKGEKGEDRKRRKMVAARFGKTGVLDDGRAVESAYFEVEEKFPGERGVKDVFRPTIGVRLVGPHVFAGVRAMAENKGGGAVVEKLPGWMVGEEGVSSGIIRNRKLLRKMADGKFSKA